MKTLILPRQGEVAPKASEGEDRGEPSKAFPSSPSVRYAATSPWQGRITPLYFRATQTLSIFRPTNACGSDGSNFCAFSHFATVARAAS